jgi:CRISPR-associated protein Cmr5
MAEQPKKSLQQTLDQQRAMNAMQVVQEVLTKFPPKMEKDPATGKDMKIPHADAKKFGGQSRKLPTRIIASGLGQALVFLKAKDVAPDLLIALADWVLYKRTDVKNHPKVTDDALLKAVIAGSATYLRQATDEALAYLQWLNRSTASAKRIISPTTRRLSNGPHHSIAARCPRVDPTPLHRHRRQSRQCPPWTHSGQGRLVLGDGPS